MYFRVHNDRSRPYFQWSHNSPSSQWMFHCEHKQCSTDRHLGCFWLSPIIKHLGASLGVVKMSFWGCGCQQREERRALSWASFLALWASVSFSVKRRLILVPASEEECEEKWGAILEPSKLFLACRGSQLGKGVTYSSDLAMEGWELWFLRVEPAWNLKQPIALNSWTCFGSICP